MMFQSQQRQPDKPHQCDQCPTAFTRNHDLKRHKRIHWAVKPFPCDGCEKAFSRKDALKVSTELGWAVGLLLDQATSNYWNYLLTPNVSPET